VAVNGAARFLRLARVRCAAHGRGPANSSRAPRVYTSLDDLVRDMNAIRAAEEAGVDLGGFHPGLVLNRCRAAIDQSRDDLLNRLQQEVGEGVDLAIHAEIPEDETVDRSMRLLAPLVELAPTAPASRTIVALAERISPHAAEAWPGQAPEALETARV
jgi:MinD-like ATPase involved in chromosome partitioning or flagellar assembly